MLVLGGKAADSAQGVEMAAEAISSGAAWQKFRTLVEAQGGDVRFVDEPDRLPQARLIEPLLTPGDGFLRQVNAAEVGLAVMDLGGGRERKGDPIDHAVGVVTHYKIGDAVQKGTPLCTVHANGEAGLAASRERLLAAHTIGPDPVEPLPMFYLSIG